MRWCVAAAEVYPTSVRSTAHGLSAAAGKCGALVPTVLFNYVGNTTKFWIVCWAGLLGFFVTILFIPDATGDADVDECEVLEMKCHQYLILTAQKAEYSVSLEVPAKGETCVHMHYLLCIKDAEMMMQGKKSSSCTADERKAVHMHTELAFAPHLL